MTPEKVKQLGEEIRTEAAAETLDELEAFENTFAKAGRCLPSGGCPSAVSKILFARR